MCDVPYISHRSFDFVGRRIFHVSRQWFSYPLADYLRGDLTGDASAAGK